MKTILAGVRCGRRSAFTLVELLVVIAIIGILIALLLPAVQAAREAARRCQCANRFKQVGIAMHNYHAAQGTFPAGLFMWYGGGNCADPGTGPWTGQAYYGWAWGAFILPYLEQGDLHDRFDFTLQMYAYNPSFRAGAEFVADYLCPSDPQGLELVSCCSDITNGLSDPEDLARTNMASVCDSRNWSCDNIAPRRDANGVLYQQSRTKVADIRDGTTNTFLVGEVIGAGPGTNSGLFWATWNVGDTHNGINLPLRITPDHSWVIEQTGFASYHPGGCHFVMADGSVQFVVESIDQYILTALTTRAGGEAVERKFE